MNGAGEVQTGDYGRALMSDPDVTSKNGAGTYRRRYVRVPVMLDVTYVRDGSDAVKTGQLADLGGGGVRLASDEDLPLGAVLLLRFDLPSASRELVARGRIVLSFYDAEAQQFYHGMAFTQIDPRDQEVIVTYVNDEVQRLANTEEKAAD
jgi:c-di-GMP-binding flagellar brake protein YcgR